MIVGDQHGINVRYISSMSSKSLFGPSATDSSVEQQLDASGLHIDAVAVAAGLEGDDLHGREDLHRAGCR
jgi:hypothetical protein